MNNNVSMMHYKDRSSGCKFRKSNRFTVGPEVEIGKKTMFEIIYLNIIYSIYTKFLTKWYKNQVSNPNGYRLATL